MANGKTQSRIRGSIPEPVKPPGFDPGPWQRELRAFLARMGAAEDLDDLVQETLLRSVRKPPEGPPRAYLYQVAINLFRDRRRYGQRTERVLKHSARLNRINQSNSGAIMDPAEAAERSDLAAQAWRIIQTLPDNQRAALIFRIERQFTYREAARVLGCSEATVRQHFYLGIKAVRAVLAGARDG